tara:strand:- start:575 stop:868 length:294 start_codon:yes stop_codon:yes gene_type:complete
MCPQCYLTALLFAIFGSSATVLIDNPIIIFVIIFLFGIAGLWLWKGFHKRLGRGRLVKNIGMTVVVTCIFLLGYLVAAIQTHHYFEEKTQSEIIKEG